MKLALVAALTLGGCSYAFVTQPPKPATSESVCTESRAAPVVDSVLAAGLIAVGAYSLSIPSSELPDGEPFARGAGVVALAASAVYIFSAVSGFSSTSECQRLHDQ